MTWKAVSLVFRGGSDEAKALKGKQVRVKIPFTQNDFDGKAIKLVTGMIGFVGGVPDEAKDLIGIAIASSGVAPRSLDHVLRGPHSVIRCNWPTFRSNFEIDI